MQRLGKWEMVKKSTALAALMALAASAPVHAAVVISTAATQNMSCSSGTCTPTATKAVLNVTDLENDLSEFGNVRVMTTGNGVEANNIVVKAVFSSPDSTSLTLEAHKAITINAAVSIGSGTAELELQSDTLAASDTLSFGRKGNVTFGGLSDIFGINGGIFTLVGSVQGLASAVAANPSGAFALANDYDASSDGTYHNNPVATPLAGVVEGLGHRISHVAIDASGFFADVQSSGIIRDMHLTKTRVRASPGGTGAGALVASNSGTLSGDVVFVRMKVYGENGLVGGLVGTNLGTITRSSAKGTIKSGGPNNWVGGLVGNNAGTISLSSATNSISAYYVNALGGLVGSNETGGIITQSFATGEVLASDGGGVSGGLVGAIYAGSVDNSYSIGTPIASPLYAGGFAGIDDGTITKSYSTGAPNAPTYLGGFIGDNHSRKNRHCYWDITTSGLQHGVGYGPSRGVSGLTTTQLQDALPTGFNPKIWAEDPNINNGFPYLINNPPPK